VVTGPVAARLGLLSIASGLYALFAYVAADRGLESLCPFYRFTGVACPFCGLTRATHQLMKGDVEGAVRSNPLAPFLIGGILGWCAVMAGQLRSSVRERDRFMSADQAVET
jgi:hypothetical protein